MDVNSIDNSLVSLNNLSNNKQIGKSSQSSTVSNNDGFLNLTINEYNKKRDELSNSLQTFNQGIGLSKIAQQGLAKEQESIQNIQSMLTQINNNPNFYGDNNEIKNSINNELQNFRNDAHQTRYNRESLLSIDNFQSNATIEISTKEAYFSIEKPNTPLIATSISQEIAKSDFNNQNDVSNVLDTVEKGLNDLNNIQSQFQDLSKNLEISARNSIKEQIDLSTQNRKNKEINFQNEVTDFTKSNINSNSGYFVTSQANIVQDQSIRLLS